MRDTQIVAFNRVARSQRHGRVSIKRRGAESFAGLSILLLLLLLLLTGRRCLLLRYPRLLFARFAAIDDLAGHADPGGERHCVAAVAARGGIGRRHGRTAFSRTGGSALCLSVTDAWVCVIVYKRTISNSVPLGPQFFRRQPRRESHCRAWDSGGRGKQVPRGTRRVLRVRCRHDREEFDRARIARPTPSLGPSTFRIASISGRAFFVACRSSLSH